MPKEEKMHRARAWLSPVGAVASEEVLSLDATARTAEMTSSLYPKWIQKSSSASQTKNSRASNRFQRIFINSGIAILSRTFFIASQSNEVDSSQRNRINKIAFCPTFCRKMRDPNNFLRHGNADMMRLYNSRFSSAEWNHRAQSRRLSWFWRNHNHRTAFDNFRNNISCKIANNYLSRMRVFLDRHIFFVINIFKNHNEFRYA